MAIPEKYSYDIIRFARKERLPDSFVSTEVHPIESRGSNCVMVTTLAINSPWHHAREFGQQIVNTLVREFVRSQSNSNLMRFEHALKLANHTISQAAEKLGVTIDCAVALFIEQEVHFTVIGKCRLLLYRSGHLTDVTTDEATQPGQFSSVTSGDLAENEWLIVSAPSMVNFLRQQAAETWEESDADALAAHIVEQAPALERNNFFATLLRLRHDQSGSDHTVLWDNLEHATPIRLPRLRAPRFNFAPLTQALSTLLAKFKAAAPKRKVSAPIKKQEQEADVEVFESAPPLWARFGWLRRIRISRKYLVVLAVILIVVILGYRAVLSRSERAEETKVPTILEELTAVNINERATFLAAKFNYERYSELSESDKQAFSALVAESGTPLVEPKKIAAEFEQEIVAIDTFESALAAVDSTGQLWTIRDNRTVKVEQSLLIQQPRSIAFVTNERIVVSDAGGNLWLFDGTPTTQPLALTQPTLVGTGPKLVQAFSGNLYVYVPESKTVYRQAAFDKELSALRSAGVFSSLGSQLADWAINGQVVGLSDQGQVIGLRSGKVQLNGSLSKTSLPLHLATIESAPKLYALSASYLTSTDKELGSAIINFLATKTPPTDLAINPTNNSIWLAVGKVLYQLDSI